MGPAKPRRQELPSSDDARVIEAAFRDRMKLLEPGATPTIRSFQIDRRLLPKSIPLAALQVAKVQQNSLLGMGQKQSNPKANGTPQRFPPQVQARKTAPLP